MLQQVKEKVVASNRGPKSHTPKTKKETSIAQGETRNTTWTCPAGIKLLLEGRV